MDDDLKDLFRGKAIAYRSQDQIRFSEMWQLFRFGDVVINTNVKSLRAYRIVAVTGGRRIVDIEEHSKQEHLSSKESRLQTTVVRVEGGANVEYSPFRVQCLFLDSEGRHVGPRSQQFLIEAYAGKRRISTLIIVPIMALDSAGSEVRERLVRRGKSFVDCMRQRYFNHSGVSIGELCYGHARDCA